MGFRGGSKGWEDNEIKRFSPIWNLPCFTVIEKLLYTLSAVFHKTQYNTTLEYLFSMALAWLVNTASLQGHLS